MERQGQDRNLPPQAEVIAETTTKAEMNSEKITQITRDIYKSNSFVKLCGMSIDKVDFGRCELSMRVDPEKHTNLWGSVHGGALYSLADTCCGVCGVSVGARVVTVNMNMSFIRNIRAGETAVCKGHVTHLGRTTMVVATEMFNEQHKLMCQGTAVMLLKARYDFIPEHWGSIIPMRDIDAQLEIG